MSDRERFDRVVDEIVAESYTAPCTAAQRESMRAFAGMLSPCAPSPSIWMTEDGEASYSWTDGPLFADVRFLRSGRVNVFMRRDDEVFGNENDDGVALDSELVAMLLREVNGGEVRP